MTVRTTLVAVTLLVTSTWAGPLPQDTADLTPFDDVIVTESDTRDVTPPKDANVTVTDDNDVIVTITSQENSGLQDPEASVEVDKAGVDVSASGELAQAASVVIRPPTVEKVTHVTSPNQYQKLYTDDGQYKFGFDDERQFRVEERLGGGQLRGIYGYRNPDGSITAFMYTFDGSRYKQVPYTVEDIPDDLRIVPEPQNTGRFV